MALYAHMRQIVYAATDSEGRVMRPMNMDPSSLLMASASLRTLLFDDTGTPLLISATMDRECRVETIESNVSMLLLSIFEHEECLHVSDFLCELILNPSMHEEYPVDCEREFLLLATGPRSYESVMSKPDLWITGIEEGDKLGAHVGAGNGGPMQLGSLIRRNANLPDWGRINIGLLKTHPISRRSIVNYVANKLGGVHFDSKRLPQQSEKYDFRLLATAMDWEQSTFMHAGLVAVAICCVELLNATFFRELYTDLLANVAHNS